jgi:hypothetical protein
MISGGGILFTSHAFTKSYTDPKMGYLGCRGQLRNSINECEIGCTKMREWLVTKEKL